jgi:hypothetical protein
MTTYSSTIICYIYHMILCYIVLFYLCIFILLPDQMHEITMEYFVVCFVCFVQRIKIT